jgi:CHAD domain-containing protein
LKRGDPADLFSFARTIIEAAPLKLGVLSKDERGELLGHEAGEQGAPTLMVDAGMTVGQAFEQIAGSCIRHFRLNEAPILTDWDEGALHQARIAMRRLRGALDFFRPAIRQSGLSTLETEVRWLAGSLADARDIDVFMAQHDALGRADRKRLKAAREAAYAEAVAAVDSPRLRNLLLDLVQWLALGKWQKKTASRSLSKFADERLDKRWNMVRQRASHLAELDDKGLHRLRIAVKKLRYAVDFLGPLYGKRARKIASRLGKIQDCLGLINDEAVSRKLIADLSLRIADACPAERARRLDMLEKHFHKLAEAGRFW